MLKKKWLLFLVGLVIPACLAGILYYLYFYQSEPAGEVCLNVFSGQPNPCWKISEKETKKLISTINSLPDTEWKNIKSPNLGYGGIHASIAVPEGLTSDLSPASINIYQGMISYNIDASYMFDSYSYFDQKNPHLKYKKDDGRKIERWLLETGKSNIDNKIYSLTKSVLE